MPVCREAKDMLAYFNPDALEMLNIMYADEETKQMTPLYRWIGVLDGNITAWAVRPPMCRMMTIEEFLDELYWPWIHSFDLP